MMEGEADHTENVQNRSEMDVPSFEDLARPDRNYPGRDLIKTERNVESVFIKDEFNIISDPNDDQHFFNMDWQFVDQPSNSTQFVGLPLDPFGQKSDLPPSPQTNLIINNEKDNNRAPLLKRCYVRLTRWKDMSIGPRRSYFVCTICERVFSDRETQQSHVLRSHPLSVVAVKSHDCHLCDGTFTHLINLERHLRAHAGYKSLQCDICHQKFSVKAALRDHHNVHTGEKPYQCHICGLRYVSRTGLRSHVVQSHTKRDTFMCKLCLYRTWNADYFRMHVCEPDADPKPIKCEYCSYATSNRSHLKRHASVHTGIKPHECGICHSRFTQRNALQEHMNTHTGNKPYRCKFCRYTSASQANLARHKKLHSDSGSAGPFGCKLCKYRTSNRDNLLKHTERHIRERIFEPEGPVSAPSGSIADGTEGVSEDGPGVSRGQTSVAGLDLREGRTKDGSEDRIKNETQRETEGKTENRIENESETRIERVNENTDDQFAEENGKTSENRIINENEPPLELAGLIIKTEQPETKTTDADTSKPASTSARNSKIAPNNRNRFMCNVCDKHYRHKKDLDNHLWCHSSSPNFILRPKPKKPLLQCEFCPYKAQYKSDLQLHTRTHTKEKPYRCAHCDYAAALKATLVVHVRRHTGFKPHKCHLCNYACVDSRGLTAHSRMHTRFKPHECKVCQQRFSRKQLLDDHANLHTGERPYECPACGSEFATGAMIRRHMRGAHGKDDTLTCRLCGYETSKVGDFLKHGSFHSKKGSNHRRSAVRSETSSSKGGESVPGTAGTPEEIGSVSVKAELDDPEPIPVTDASPTTESEQGSTVMPPKSEAASIDNGSKSEAVNDEGTKITNENSSKSQTVNDKIVTTVEGSRPRFPRAANRVRVHSSYVEVTCKQRDSVKGKYRLLRCGFCPYEAPYKSQLKTHLKTHTKEKPFGCDKCEYRAATRSGLGEHARRHSEERPFKCDVCDFSCRHKVNLKTHKRTHTGEKPFKCEVCDRAFKQNSMLLDHMNFHTGNKPYACHFCSYRTAYASGVWAHLKTCKYRTFEEVPSKSTWVRTEGKGCKLEVSTSDSKKGGVVTNRTASNGGRENERGTVPSCSVSSKHEIFPLKEEKNDIESVFIVE